MLSFLLSPDNVPFVAALVLMLLIGVVEAAGLGGGFAIGEAGEVDVGLETPSLLSWINIGRLPLLMLVVVFLFAFGMIGLIAQQVLQSLVGAPLTWILAAPLSGAAALPATRAFGRIVARLVPLDETTAVSRDSLVGRIAVIVTGEARHSSAAQARVRDRHGQAHYIMVEPDDANDVFSQGESVILVRHSGATYFAVHNISPSLRDVAV